MIDGDALVARATLIDDHKALVEASAPKAAQAAAFNAIGPADTAVDDLIRQLTLPGGTTLERVAEAYIALSNELAGLLDQ